MFHLHVLHPLRLFFSWLALTLTCLVLFATPAHAWTYEQARTGTLGFAYDHCGSYWRTCNAVWFVQCYGTGTITTYQTQWACLAGDVEKRKWWAWWLTPFKNCTIGVAFRANGGVNNWSKACNPLEGVSLDLP